MRARSRTTVATGLGLVAVLALSACGAGVEPLAPEEAAAPTTGAPTDADAGAPSTTAVAPGGPVAVLGETVERTAAVESGRYEMVVTYDAEAVGAEPVAPLRATGEFADQGRSLRMEMDLGEPVGTIEQVVVDGIAYVTVPGVGCQELDRSDVLSSVGGSGGGAMDPGSFLEQLRAIDGDVEEVGRLDVRGVSTTRFAATYTLADAIAAMPEDQADALEQMYATLPRSFLDTEQAVDVFVDDDGLVRRMQVATTSSDVEGLPLPATTTIMDWFDFGAEVSVEAPTDCEATVVSPFGPAGDLTA
ncbi:MAG TPA: hypothetical protein PKA98_00620 [Acidimicrobiales bacterium]|nr:hypothetical protein [Acidimicrobiales bacterium]